MCHLFVIVIFCVYHFFFILSIIFVPLATLDWRHLLSLCINVPGAYEGLACAAIVLLKHDVSALPVQRNSSFSLRHELLPATGSLRSQFLLALQ